MSMKACKECGKEISSKAQSCPNCGAVLKKKTGCLTYIGAIFLFFIILGIFSTAWMGSTKPKSGLVLPSIGEQIVDFEKYKKIENGMSYKKVVSIIGTEGEEMSKNKIDGIPKVMDSIETVMYQWVNSNGSNMNAVFQNDKLIQKAQFGLK